MCHHNPFSFSSHLAPIERSPTYFCTLMERPAIANLRLTQQAPQHILQWIVSDYLFCGNASSISLLTTFSFPFLSHKACNQATHGSNGDLRLRLKWD